MQNTQQLADLHMALRINSQLYAAEKITAELHEHAGRMFAERLAMLEKHSQQPLRDDDGCAIMSHRTQTTK